MTGHEFMHAPLFAKAVHVHEIFSLLFGGETQVRELPQAIPANDQAAVACYVNGNFVVQHALICDFAFANSAGAALCLVPAAVVNQAVQKKIVDENLIDNIKEIMNICANLFSPSETEQVRLQTVHVPPKSLDGYDFGAPLVFEVQIPRYPVGKIQVVSLV